MKLKRIASAFLAGALALSLAACGGSASTSAAASASGSAAGSASAAAGSDLDYIKGKGKMVIGYTVYEPMNYTDVATLPALIPNLPLRCVQSWA